MIGGSVVDAFNSEDAEVLLLHCRFSQWLHGACRDKYLHVRLAEGATCLLQYFESHRSIY